MRWATEREIKNPICAPYMNNQFSNLFEPQYSTDGSTCYHIYSHRKYSENNNPITETMYQEYFDSKEREMWLKYIGMGALISTLLSMFVYGAGVVASWIIKGFKKGEEQ